MSLCILAYQTSRPKQHVATFTTNLDVDLEGERVVLALARLIAVNQLYCFPNYIVTRCGSQFRTFKACFFIIPSFELLV